MRYSVFINKHPGVLAYNVFQLLSIIGGYRGETSNPMPYSKFVTSSVDNKGGKSKMVPSRVGMLIIYVPATIVAVVFQCLSSVLWENSTSTVAGWLVFVHFLKRDLEVMYLHKYSGDTELNVARQIGFIYSLTAFMICLVSIPMPNFWELYTGLTLFAVGSVGNLYHHYLLARLRSVSGKAYVAPRGGLFDYVAAPHYLFELIAWFGIALASEQLTGYLNFLSMTMYLSARSQNQNKWNKNKFAEKEWPSSRKNMFPGLY